MSQKATAVCWPGRLHRVVSPYFALNRTGRGGRRQNPIRADHLRRATGLSVVGLVDYRGRRQGRLYSPRAERMTEKSAVTPSAMSVQTKKKPPLELAMPLAPPTPSPFMREMRFPTEVETHLYRILQEALNNISKHAGAGRVSVILEYQDQSLTLIIEDDGRGFDLVETRTLDAQARGLGLVGMRERANLIGATLDIESTPGSGTTIYVHVPLSDPPEIGVRLEAE